MATHTPGPWTLHPGGIPYVNCGEHGPAYGPIVMAGPIEEMMANARLIAAAPDLLAVLKAAAEDDTIQWHDAPLLKAARAAIAKATGEAG